MILLFVSALNVQLKAELRQDPVPTDTASAASVSNLIFLNDKGSSIIVVTLF